PPSGSPCCGCRHRCASSCRSTTALALLGSMHFRITLALGILGRARCGDDRGIDNGALRQAQATPLQYLTYDLEDLRAELVLLQQMAKAHHRRLVGHRLTPQI